MGNANNDVNMRPTILFTSLYYILYLGQPVSSIEYGHGRCEVMAIPMCDSMPYNMTVLPNLYGYDRQYKASDDMEYFKPLIESQCYVHLRRYLCTILAPVCTRFPDPIPPCRDFCMEVKKRCSRTLENNYNFVPRWPFYFPCDQFPEKHLCVRKPQSDSDDENTGKSEKDNEEQTNSMDIPEAGDSQNSKTRHAHGEKDLSGQTTRYDTTMYYDTRFDVKKTTQQSHIINQTTHIINQTTHNINQTTHIVNQTTHIINQTTHIASSTSPSTSTTPSSTHQKTEEGGDDDDDDDRRRDSNSKPNKEASMRCEPTQVSMCNHNQVPYNMTFFPNLLGHATPKDADNDIEKFKAVVDSGCDRDFKLFLCSLYAPVCTNLQQPVLPCNKLCSKVRKRCRRVMKKALGTRWPRAFKCSQFPRTGVCILSTASFRPRVTSCKSPSHAFGDK